MTHPKPTDSEQLRGRQKLTEVDRVWNEIRDSLAACAMKNMTIPQAKVFSVEATFHLGIYFRKLVDMELAQRDQQRLMDALDKMQTIPLSDYDRTEVKAALIVVLGSDNSKTKEKTT